MSRLAQAASFKVVDIRRPFSLFQFAEDLAVGAAPVRRLLTLARQREASFIVVEALEAVDDVLEENRWLKDRYSDYENSELLRLSIWKAEQSPTDLMEGFLGDHCVGYALLKRDCIPSSSYDDWHIYEAVLRKYPHSHNYCHAVADFFFRIGEKECSIRGCLYAQQNGLNKACAQVAIRSVVATRLGRADLSYIKINRYAEEVEPVNKPGDGLNTKQISHVLCRLGLNHVPIDYGMSPQLKTALPFQKLVYSGIESGAGALMVFNMQGPDAPDDVGHIIPCFGHTFNEDAWAPQAQAAYFQIGETIRYIPSRAWASSFIVHDDNFGANLSIPVTYLKPDQVSYVAEILPEGFAYTGALAEIASADYFYSILPNLPEGENIWLDRLLGYVANQKLILRCVAISRERYIRELESMVDWDGKKEDGKVIESLREQGSGFLWMVEVAIPELFSTNKRKLGEILMNAEIAPDPESGHENFVLARLPSLYVFIVGVDDEQNPVFLTTPSKIQSHTDLFCQDSSTL